MRVGVLEQKRGEWEHGLTACGNAEKNKYRILAPGWTSPQGYMN